MSQLVAIKFTIGKKIISYNCINQDKMPMNSHFSSNHIMIHLLKIIGLLMQVEWKDIHQLKENPITIESLKP